MKKNCTVTCRYGITYDVEFIGTQAEIARGCQLMGRCCCWVCHNRDCKEPRNEVIKDCDKVCDIYTSIPYCISSYKINCK